VRDYLPFIVLGLTTGSIYALAAMGLVVTYSTSGVFNFAHGTVAMVSAFAYYSLRVNHGVPTVLAIALVVVVIGPLIGLVLDRLLFRRLQGAPSAAYVVVSIGLLVFLQGLVIVIYGPTARTVPPIFPTGTFRLPGVDVGYDQLAVVISAAVLGLALAAFFRRTQVGLDMRAVVDDPQLAELTGANATRVTALSWMLGTSFAAIAGVLLAPIVGIDVTLLTLLVVQAFGAAALGRLVSLPIAYAGSLAIGVVGQLLTKFVSPYAGGRPYLAGLPQTLPFLVLFAVLVVSRKGSFKELTKTVRSRGGGGVAVQGTPRFPLATFALLFVGGVLLPTFSDNSRMTTLTAAFEMLVVFASLSLLLGLSRQISLCHAVFVTLGATTLAHLQGQGVPFLLALLLSGLVVVPVAGLLAVPAIRLSGLFLALATFGFGILMQNLVFGTASVFGTDGAVSIRRPTLFGHTLDGTRNYYYFVFGITLACLIVIELVRVTRLGRLLRALADSDVAVETLGVNATASRTLVFCASGFFAAIAGGLLGAQVSSVSTTSFTFSDSLVWVAVLVAAGSRTLAGSVLASAMLVVVPSFVTSSRVLDYQTVGFGLLAILLAQTQNGLIGIPEGWLRRARAAGARPDSRSRSAARASRARERLVRPSEALEAAR
jgi:branched-subunit amino acid ABC-type transport system permease component